MWQKLKSSLRIKSAPLLLEHGAVLAVPDDRPNEEPEEFDLIALTSTPEQFKEPEFDVSSFELKNLPSQCTLAAIDELKDLRQRQLDVRDGPHSMQYLSTITNPRTFIMQCHCCHV